LRLEPTEERFTMRAWGARRGMNVWHICGDEDGSSVLGVERLGRERRVGENGREVLGHRLPTSKVPR